MQSLNYYLMFCCKIIFMYYVYKVWTNVNKKFLLTNFTISLLKNRCNYAFINSIIFCTQIVFWILFLMNTILILITIINCKFYLFSIKNNLKNLKIKIKDKNHFPYNLELFKNFYKIIYLRKYFRYFKNI